MSQPFILVPWQEDFMTALLDVALAEGRPLENALFIFPHSRPARYLERLIREDERIAKPSLMPTCHTVSSLFQLIWQEAHPPAVQIGSLDRVGLLLECLRAEQKERPGLINNIPSDDAKTFFPWGKRLADLYEECFSYNRVPEKFLHLEDELLPFAAAILSRLGSLYRRYIAALESNGWSTPGYTAQEAVRALQSGLRPRVFSGQKDIYIAGFYSPSGTENILFRKLWREYGAKVIIQADAKLTEGKAHWSCSNFYDWQKAWGAGLELHSSAKQPESKPKISYYSAYDLHSQLAFLRSSVHKQGRERGEEFEDTAIILPDTTLLLPVLHHIQADDVNISMGYPLDNTSLQRFIEAVLTLHEQAREGYYWKDCIRLLRQPYLKMLDSSIDEQAGGRNLWRELLLKAERVLRSGRRYVDLAEVMENALRELEPGENLEKVTQLWESVRNVCLKMWKEVSSLADLGNTLEMLVNLLLEKGTEIWPRFPIDAECLSRFSVSIIPELKNSSISQEVLPQGSIFSIFRELASAERIPFDAYPLTVLQVMGLLESRLLSFKSVFILDATDDLLPGGVQHDPLLPDTLRKELGLPDSARRQRQTAYYFFRLLGSAEEVHIFWQEGVEPQGVLDGKKLRSRLVEELLWQEELKLGRLLEPKQLLEQTAPELPPLMADGPLHQVGSKLSAFRTANREITVTDTARKRLAQILSAPISATRLNNYMRCPAGFYYRELAALDTPKLVTEDEDPASVGNLFHQVLKEFYEPRLGQPLQKKDLSRIELSRLFKETMRGHEVINDMLADARLMLGLAGERRLRSYLDNQPEETTIVALEQAVTAPLSTPGGQTFQLFGYLDRIDRRIQADGEPGLIILDYKTGRVDPPSPEIWLLEDMWESLGNEEVNLADRGFFCSIADAVHDLQLPFYLYLASFGNIEGVKTGSGQERLCNAGWIGLRDKGEESFIFHEDIPWELRSEIIDTRFSLLLEYLLKHMANAPSFFPRPGKRCEFCDYKDICVVLS